VTLTVVGNEFDSLIREDLIRKRYFAAHYAYGTPLVKAMRLAGFEKPNKPAAVKLVNDDFVREEMQRHFTDLQNSLMQTREAIIAQLDDAIELAHNLENPPAVIAGIVAKAKILGLMTADGNSKNLPSKITVEWGDESHETIYEKSNPLIYDAITTTIGDNSEKEQAK
jgi:hypothetical protein